MLKLALDHSVLAPRQARRAVQDLIGDDAAVAFIRDALLLTSEIVTNAVEHAGTGCELNATFDSGRAHLRVEVSDSSTTLPRMDRGDPGQHMNRGRGLWIVNEIAERCGVDARADGKTVWFELLGASSG